MLLNKRISIKVFLMQIRFDVIALVLYAVLVGLADGYSFLAEISIPLSASAIIGTALSLLLAFRTAQAYERWWEARTVWGAIVNDSRSLIRQIQCFVPQNTEAIQAFSDRQVMWCYALGESLRRLPFSEKVEDYIRQNNIKGRNIPNAILNEHGKALSLLELNEYQRVQIDSTLNRLCDSMGKCERIKNTVFPRSYSVLVHFLIYVFATLLPFGLEDKYVAVEIFLTILVPVIFIAIERTAIIMQDPFENVPTDIPCTNLATTIEINIREAIDDPNVPIMQKPESYYIM